MTQDHGKRPAQGHGERCGHHTGTITTRESAAQRHGPWGTRGTGTARHGLNRWFPRDARDRVAGSHRYQPEIYARAAGGRRIFRLIETSGLQPSPVLVWKSLLARRGPPIATVPPASPATFPRKRDMQFSLPGPIPETVCAPRKEDNARTAKVHSGRSGAAGADAAAAFSDQIGRRRAAADGRYWADSADRQHCPPFDDDS